MLLHPFALLQTGLHRLVRLSAALFHLIHRFSLFNKPPPPICGPDALYLFLGRWCSPLPHALHWLLRRWSGHMFAPPHALHLLLMSWCLQMPALPHSLHWLLRLPLLLLPVRPPSNSSIFATACLLLLLAPADLASASSFDGSAACSGGGNTPGAHALREFRLANILYELSLMPISFFGRQTLGRQ